MENSYIIAKLDTEGDIILRVDKAEDGKVLVTISTPNNEGNSQLLTNLEKMAINGENKIEEPDTTSNEKKKFSFFVEKTQGQYIINLAGNNIVYLDENLYPLEGSNATLKEGSHQVELEEKIYATTKTRLAQKTDFNLEYSDEIFSSPSYIEMSQEKLREKIGKTDLHNHLAGLLPPNRLISLGIRHNVDYNILLLQKYDIDISERPDLMTDLIKQVLKIKDKSGDIIGDQYVSPEVVELLNGNIDEISEEKITKEYNKILGLIEDETIPRKPLEDVAIPFNDIITIQGNLEKISLSMRLPIEGQAVFTNLEEVYDARDPFTKNNGRVVQRGENDKPWSPIVPIDEEIESVLSDLRELSSYEASEVCEMLEDMSRQQAKIETDPKAPEGIAQRFRNGLQEDMHLWIGMEANRGGVEYIETSQATLAKDKKNKVFLDTVNGEPNILQYIEQITGTTIKYLAAIRRNFETQAEFDEAARKVIESAKYECCAGVDFMGEELNETDHFSATITDIARYAIEEDPQFVIRVHAGENDANPRNIGQVVDAVDKSFIESYKELHNGQDVPRTKDGDIDFSKMSEMVYPQIRIGHGLYGPINDEELMNKMAERGIIVEFNISSNVRLNNMQPEKVVKTFKELIDGYSKAGGENSKGIGMVFCTDGYGIYGTSTKDEIEYAMQVLQLSKDDIERIGNTEERAIEQGKGRKTRVEKQNYEIESKKETEAIQIAQEIIDEVQGKIAYGEGKDVFKDKIPIIIAGGSFSTDIHNAEARERQEIGEEDKAIIDKIIEDADPEKIVFVIGHTGAAQEGYLLDRLGKMEGQSEKKDFEVIAVSPTNVKTNKDGKVFAQTEGEKDDINSAFRVALNPLIKGIITDGASREGASIYKAFQKRVFNKPGATLVAFDGNAALSNLIQEARNTGVNIWGKAGVQTIEEKAETLGRGPASGKNKGEIHVFNPISEVMQGTTATYEDVNEALKKILSMAREIDKRIDTHEYVGENNEGR